MAKFSKFVKNCKPADPGNLIKNKCKISEENYANVDHKQHL